MAQDPSPKDVDSTAAIGAPLAGTRSQRIQRLQVGAVGLAMMVLLVGLADIISENAAENQAAAQPEDLPAVTIEDVPPPPPPAPRDPLVDAGVAPELPVDPDEGEEPVTQLPPPELGDVEPLQSNVVQ